MATGHQPSTDRPCHLAGPQILAILSEPTEGDQTSAVDLPGLFLPDLCQRSDKGGRSGSLSFKAAFTFSGVSTCLPPSPPVHGRPFYLPNHVLMGRKTASVFSFPWAPLCRVGESVGCCRVRGGSTPCAGTQAGSVTVTVMEAGGQGQVTIQIQTHNTWTACT